MEFLENKHSSENQSPPNRQNMIFLRRPFYKAPSLHIVEIDFVSLGFRTVTVAAMAFKFTVILKRLAMSIPVCVCALVFCFCCFFFFFFFFFFLGRQGLTKHRKVCPHWWLWPPLNSAPGKWGRPRRGSSSFQPDSKESS